MKNLRFEAIVIAIGLLLLGVFIERGISSFADKDRRKRQRTCRNGSTCRQGYMAIGLQKSGK